MLASAVKPWSWWAACLPGVVCRLPPTVRGTARRLKRVSGTVVLCLYTAACTARAMPQSTALQGLQPTPNPLGCQAISCLLCLYLIVCVMDDGLCVSVFGQCRRLAADVRCVVHTMAVDACVSACVTLFADGLVEPRCDSRRPKQQHVWFVGLLGWQAVCCGVQNAQQHPCCSLESCLCSRDAMRRCIAGRYNMLVKYACHVDVCGITGSRFATWQTDGFVIQW
jgi:hypothetical protein